MNKNRPKRHHYLPESYLRRFCNNGLFWVFDREENKYRKLTPKNTCVISHYYSFEDEDGGKNVSVEEELLSLIDGEGTRIIEKIDNGEIVSSSEKETLAIYTSFMMFRVPDFEKSINNYYSQLMKNLMDVEIRNKDRFQKTIDECKEKGKVDDDISAQDVIDFYKSGKYTIEVHRNKSLGLMLKLSPTAANYFRQMDWLFLHPPGNKYFVTSDNPFVVVPPKPMEEQRIYGVGIIKPGVSKIIPLSAKTVLLMLDRGELLKHRKIDSAMTRRINVTLASYSDRFLISSSKILLESIVRETRLNEWKNGGRFCIGKTGGN